MKTGTAEALRSRAFPPATIKVREAALLWADSCDSWMQSAKNEGYEKTMMQMCEGKTAAILTRIQKKKEIKFG